MRHFLGLTVAVLVTACTAQAEADVSGKYEVTTEGTTAKVKAGEKGTVVIAINAKPGAYVSEEAPLKIELSSAAAKLDKQKLTLADSVTKKAEGSKDHPNPRFEVGFTTAAKATIEAKMVFFICTEKVCARQTKQLSLPVDVN